MKFKDGSPCDFCVEPEPHTAILWRNMKRNDVLVYMCDEHNAVMRKANRVRRGRMVNRVLVARGERY